MWAKKLGALGVRAVRFRDLGPQVQVLEGFTHALEERQDDKYHRYHSLGGKS